MIPLRWKFIVTWKAKMDGLFFIFFKDLFKLQSSLICVLVVI